MSNKDNANVSFASIHLNIRNIYQVLNCDAQFGYKNKQVYFCS